MKRQTLIKTLEELRTELTRSQSCNPETLAKLEKLTSELQRELEKPRAKDKQRVEPASRGLKDLLLEFEAEHPQLSVTIGKVADALAAIGI